MGRIARLGAVGVFVVSLLGATSCTGGEARAYNNVCGQLALAAAAEQLREARAVDDVFALLPASGKPSTLKDLDKAARRLGFLTSAVHWRDGLVPLLPGPAIIRLRSSSLDVVGHFVTLLGSTGDLVLVLDLPSEPRWVPIQELWRTWDGVALHVALSRSRLPTPEGGLERMVPSVIGILLGLWALFLLLRNPTPLQGLWGGSPSWAGRFLLGGVALSASAVALALVNAAPRDLTRRPVALVVSPPTQDIVLDDAKDSKSAPSEAVFRISNPGALPARIKSFETSCGCALPTLSSSEVPAGGSVTLSVAIRPPESGSQPFTIRLFVDRPLAQVLVLPGSVRWKGTGRLAPIRALDSRKNGDGLGQARDGGQ